MTQQPRINHQLIHHGALQVVTLLRWRIVELYYREVDELLYELSSSDPGKEWSLVGE